MNEASSLLDSYHSYHDGCKAFAGHIKALVSEWREDEDFTLCSPLPQTFRKPSNFLAYQMYISETRSTTQIRYLSYWNTN